MKKLLTIISLCFLLGCTISVEDVSTLDMSTDMSFLRNKVIRQAVVTGNGREVTIFFSDTSKVTFRDPCDCTLRMYK